MAEVHGHEEDDEGVVAATLEYVARALVDHPDSVQVSRHPGEPRPVVRLDVHPEDIGRVIGRGGRMARAIRGVAKAAAALDDLSVHIQIGEPRDRGESRD
ncbi:MAG TPA: KH domain-containing protein [Actinomycetota bacterium]